MAQIKSKEKYYAIMAKMNERNYSQKELASLMGISAPKQGVRRAFAALNFSIR